MTFQHLVLLLVSPSLTFGFRIVERIDKTGSVARQTLEDGPFGGSEEGSPRTDGGELQMNGDISAISLRSGVMVGEAYSKEYVPSMGRGGYSIRLVLH